jgi:CarboxypepD_reg-like domain
MWLGLSGGALGAVPVAHAQVQTEVKRANSQTLGLETKNMGAEPYLFTGKILSIVDRTPLPGGGMYVKSDDYGTSTNAWGEFSLDLTKYRLKNQPVVVVIHYVGFLTQEIPIDFTKTDFTHILMKEDVREMGEVVVTKRPFSFSARSLPCANYSGKRHVRPKSVAPPTHSNFAQIPIFP